jgi:hypothetical protein
MRAPHGLRALLAAACAAAASLAAHAERANPILDPEQPWGFQGFSLRPPADAGWYSLTKSHTGAVLGRRTDSPTHTLVATVHSERLGRPFESAEALVAQQRARRTREIDPARARILGAEAVREDLGGAWCARYRIDAEERADGARVFRLHIEGRSCAHPVAPELLVELTVAERGLDGEGEDAARARSAPFLDSLRFTPVAPSADLLHAEDLIRRGATAEAVPLLERLAAQGEPAAALRAARAYESGRGVPVDAPRAERLYRLAAAAGEVDALYNLGALYDKARGGVRDAREAARWFRRAADQRDSQAQLNLGILFYKGDGVPLDHAQARAWFELAADNGNARAKRLLGTLEFGSDAGDAPPARPAVVIDAQ